MVIPRRHILKSEKFETRSYPCICSMVVLPFDAHNHVHMGVSPPSLALEPFQVCGEKLKIGGMAIMSTHPRDFVSVSSIGDELRVDHGINAVKCFGVHPWFVSELEESDSDSGLPQWLLSLEEQLNRCPDAVVGEIGLDGFHFNGETGELSAPMEKQIEVFRLQMELAAKRAKPVSIHAVQCFGVLMETLSLLKKQKKMPPRMYFHAFGGKLGTIDQILALCGRKVGQVYFGFSPVVSKYRAILRSHAAA